MKIKPMVILCKPLGSGMFSMFWSNALPMMLDAPQAAQQHHFSLLWFDRVARVMVCKPLGINVKQNIRISQLVSPNRAL